MSTPPAARPPHWRWLSGSQARAAALLDQAASLRASFDRAFWCDDIGTYALALDGNKRPCRVRSSNAGQCLFGGIADTRRVERVSRALLDEDSFSGWGIRTLAAGQARYNPMGYHTGAVWPHDNALIARGLARYGCADEAIRIQQAMFDASRYFDAQRMPELFCGFARTTGEAPAPYPLACAPQAWAAGSVLLLLQAALGLHVDGCNRRVVFSAPRLPQGVDQLSLLGLAVHESRVDLRIVRHRRSVGVNILHGDRTVEVVVT
jgi:glycogen debranching enzyme